jgi:hypothetical protein
MRPVKRHRLAQRPAEQRRDRRVGRLGCEVDAGILDGGDGLRVEPARREPDRRVEFGRDRGESARNAGRSTVAPP